MPPSTSIHRNILSKAGQGDLAHLEVLRKILLAEPQQASPAVVDVLFHNLASRPVPAKLDLDRNFHLVAFAATAPALCLSLFWIIFNNNTSMQQQVKAAVVRNLVEYGAVFCQWTQFCLSSGHPCLPEDELGGSLSTTEQQRYPKQAALLKSLLDIDETFSQALLTSNAFIVLVLQLWNGEYARYEDRILRVMDLSKHDPCPIVCLTLDVVTNELSRRVFFQRFCNRKLCHEFVQPLVERIQWGKESPNSQYSGYTESLVRLFRIGEALWSSSALFHRHLQEVDFLGLFCHSWTGVSSFFATLAPVRADIRNTILVPTLSSLFIVALRDKDSRSVCHNWRNLAEGGFFGLLFQTLLRVDVKTWSSISYSMLPTLCIFLAYPRLITPDSFGDISMVDVMSSGNLKIITTWNAFSKAFHRTKAAREILEKRPSVHVCDNPMCDNTDTGPMSLVKQCQGCWSVAYCSLPCQKEDWRERHRKECADARISHIELKRQDEVYTHKTRASQATLLEVLYAEKDCPRYSDRSIIPVFDFTAIWSDSIEQGSYVHHLFGFDTYWRRKSTSETSFAQTFLRPRMESLVNAYVEGRYPTGWRLAEGIFPMYAAKESVYLMVLLKPEGVGYKSVHCVARYMH